MRWSQITQGALKSNEKRLLQEMEKKAGTDRVKEKVNIRITPWDAQNTRSQQLEGVRQDPPLEPGGRAVLLTPQFQTFGIQN
jgi:hypothetical protein